MKNLLPLLALLAFAPLAFAKGPEKIVTIKDAKGSSLGTIKLRTLKQGVELKLDLKGISPGEHAMHFHQKPLCEGPDFKSAGGHFNPAGKKHGLENPEGSHAGDMLNFTANEKGEAKATIVNKAVTLGAGENSLLAGEGTSVVIHAAADDMKTDPSGNSGDRVACGVIAK